MMKLTFTLLLLILFTVPTYASHIMGGEISWKCVGGNYVFQLTYYRDCNGADVNTVSVNLDVWNHPSLFSIPLAFVSREDISPFCQPVGGSPGMLSCGSGTGGGNGVGAIEKIIYRSNPISISGTPPSNGWIFTFQDFSRSGAITNFTNPSSYGITLMAKMYAIHNSPGGCVDSSPTFLQEPYFVSCAGTPYEYSSNIIDPDLDSTTVEFGIPYNNFPSGTSYNPPINPIPVPFEPGFSFVSPTPNTVFNAGNVAATVNNETGHLSFTSYTQGNFNIKLIAKSYRNGALIAEVEREMQLIVTPCNTQNNPPTIFPPFAGGSYETTVIAGSAVNFTLSATDAELLQDGTPQSVLLSSTGPMYGTNFTSTTGCDIEPCATLNATPIISGVQSVSANFSWQTSCDHLANQYGVVADVVPYNFVFKIQDDYCQVPKIRYATVTINVVNPGVIQAPTINCIQTNAAGDATINWEQVNNPTNSFVSYQVNSVQNGALTTINDITTTSYTDPGTTGQNDYYVTVFSGCGGNTPRISDTISSIFLTLNNPSNGTAVLQWNNPTNNQLPSMNDYYYIMREYPTSVWTIRDSVPYGTMNFIDTIDICSTQLNYQIKLKNDPCDYLSNIVGDVFEDVITPDIPVVTSVSVDTLTNAMTITWNVNDKPDTYGYIIYYIDNNGFISELDTVWGLNTTTYSYFPDDTPGIFTYSVAAFDSCHLASDPNSFQTSAKAEPHSSIYAQATLNYCENTVNLSWTGYGGWTNLEGYEILGKIAGQNWQVFDTVTDLSVTLNVLPHEDYCFVVKAFSDNGKIAFSNSVCLSIEPPAEAQFNYIRSGTVVGNDIIEIKAYVDALTNVQELILERYNLSAFIEIQRTDVGTSNDISFIDNDVQTDRYTYQYRTIVVDDCGDEGMISNTVRPMLLTIQSDSVQVKHYLHWTPYYDYAGSLLAYNIYRGSNGVLDPTPIATVSGAQTFYVDNVEYNQDLVNTGNTCYLIEAVESMNMYGFKENAHSNMVCPVINPLVYIPNSFTPDGNEFNQHFIPKFSFFDITRYKLTIYDRWEHVIWESEDYTEGWHGQVRSSGYMAETGTYTYKLSVYDGNGYEIVRRGHVNLLR